MDFKQLINNFKQLFTRNQQTEPTPVQPENQNIWDNLTLGDRMKLYESFFTGKNFPGKYPNWPSRHCIRVPGGWPFGLNGYTEVPEGFYPIIRVDGHCFSTFTRQFNKPYDMRIIDAMLAATIKLVDDFHALLGYTQSDEITIVLPPDAEIFGRKCQKLATLAASTAAVAFYNSLVHTGYCGKLPAFDARTFGVPNADEAANCIVWRERDAIKNSISNVARKFYSDKANRRNPSVHPGGNRIASAQAPSAYSTGRYLDLHSFQVHLDEVSACRTHRQLARCAVWRSRACTEGRSYRHPRF